MPELKLAKLPDRTPVKIAITVTPELDRKLRAYAELYRVHYGESEPIAMLIPAMLESFLKSDIAFSKAWRERGKENSSPNREPGPQSRTRQRPAIAELSPTSS